MLDGKYVEPVFSIGMEENDITH